MFTLIVRNDNNPKAVEASFMLSSYLQSQGIEFDFIDSSTLYDHDITECDVIFDRDSADLAVVLGGDGTILRTAHLLSDVDVPILGINFGNLGFLANASEGGVLELVSRALAGELLEDKRANLRIDVVCEGSESEFQEETNKAISSEESGVDKDGARGRRSFFALNEAAITRGALGRMIQYSLDVSGVHIADVTGDGVIVATSTGSTAYSLAAGGPIVHPGFNGLIIQPLAPHTLTARAMLTDSSDVACIDLTKTRSGREATLFIDGDIVLFDSPIKQVYIRRGDKPTTLLYSERDHFYRYSEKTFFKK